MNLMRRLFLTGVAKCVAFIVTLPLIGATPHTKGCDWYVDCSNGSDFNSGNSWSEAVKNIPNSRMQGGDTAYFNSPSHDGTGVLAVSTKDMELIRAKRPIIINS